MVLWELFITFFQIGLFTIGGGQAMIPLIAQEVVDHGWMTLSQLTDIIGISESTPGPYAVNIATFVGMTAGDGLVGAVWSTLGVILPSFVIMLFIAKYFQNIQDNFYINAAFTALRPATFGLIFSAIYMIAGITLFSQSETGSVSINWKGIIILGALIAIKLKFKKIHPILLIGISAGLGILVFSLIP